MGNDEGVKKEEERRRREAERVERARKVRLFVLPKHTLWWRLGVARRCWVLITVPPGVAAGVAQCLSGGIASEIIRTLLVAPGVRLTLMLVCS